MVDSQAEKCSPQTVATRYPNIHLLESVEEKVCLQVWGKATIISRVKYAIYKDNYKMLKTAFHQVKWSAKWIDLIQKSEKCVHDIKVSIVKLLKPEDQLLKVYTDGSALTNPGRQGACGIPRDK